MSKYFYNDEIHRYSDADGNIYPGVTSPLPKNDFAMDPYSALRGQAVHKVVELHEKGSLDVDSLTPETGQLDLRPYYEAYLSFRNHHHDPIGLTDIKTGVANPTTILQLGGYNKLYREGETIDGEKPPYLGYEVKLFHPIYRYAGTADIIEIEGPIYPVHVLYLRPDGTFRLSDDFRKEMKSAEAYFMSFMTSYQWKLAYLKGAL
jgi:hypothetical protein